MQVNPVGNYYEFSQSSKNALPRFAVLFEMVLFHREGEMTIKPRFPAKAAGPVPSLPAPPHDVYVHGDALPVPEVIEKDSDSVWALWSDAINGTPDRDAETQPATLIMGLQDLPKERARKGQADKDTETQPATLLMGLQDLPKEPGA